MFKELVNEAILTFDIKTQSPLYIKSGNDNSLNPSAADGSYITTYRNSKLEPFIPGTSLKGVFRSRAEQLLKSNGSCDIVNNGACLFERDAKRLNGKERYKKSCPICRLFGSKVLKSRATFSDAYVSGNYKVGERTCVGINRVLGASKQQAPYNMEYIDEAIFNGKITLKNFEPYQVKLILMLFKEMNDGFLTLGGMTSKGFGMVKGDNFKLNLRYYGSKSAIKQGYEFKDYYYEKNIQGFDDIFKLVENINISKLRRDGDVDEQTI